MIDKNTGNIKFTNLLELSPKSSYALMEEQDLGEVREVLNMGIGNKWLIIKNIPIDNKYFIISLFYNQEKLTEVSMIFSEERFDLSAGWDSRNEKKEKDNLKKYQIWLDRELDRKTKFHWGDVWADYDP